MNKKIVFFTGAMSRGGAERVISILSRRYAELGWSVQIATILHSYVEYDLDERVKVVDLSSDKGIRKDCLRVLYRIRQYLKIEKPDISVVFMAPICLLVGVAACGLKIPMIMSERNDPSQGNRNIFYELLINHFYSSNKKTILQTKRVRGYFPKKVQNNSVIIANPICVQSYASSESTHKIVSAGRLVPQKNQQMLIKAFADFKISHPEYSLEIYGEGPLREKLQILISELGLSDCVKLPGNVPNIHECIRDAEMFVLPSDFEGLSNALLEAMMMGLACISTDCAGSDEAITDGVNGLLVPVGDTQKLTQAMQTLAEDKLLAQQLAKAAKASSERYRVENVISQWREAIEGFSAQ